MPDDDLPIVLVSAADAAAANTIICELVDNEVECLRKEGAVVWELSNKYYTARVRVCAWPDAASGPAPAAEAHIIYLSEHECNGCTLERRAGAVPGERAVRLAVCAGTGAGEEEGGLSDAARKHRYELVYLCSGAGEAQEAGAGEGGAFPELRGAARAREALHAHAWPGLRMRTRGPAPPAPPPDRHDHDDFSPFQRYQTGSRGASSSSRSGSSSPEPAPGECVRRAELLAGTLAAVRGARGQGGRGEGGRAERALRAEQVVAAFCRALGTDMARL